MADEQGFDPRFTDQGSTPQSQASIREFLDRARTPGLFRHSGPAGDLVQAGAGTAGRLGISSLIDILSSRGRTDPAMFNQQVADIQRGTQGQQQQIQQQGAQAGLQGSGVMAALQAATGQAGEDRIAGAKAQETALAEQRRREDLDLFIKMILDPSMELFGTHTNLDQIEKQRSLQRQLGAANFLASGLGAIFGGGGGGGGGNMPGGGNLPYEGSGNQ